MPRFQFSMRWLLIAITIVCIFLFLWVTMGGFVGIIFGSLIWCIVPTPLIITAIFGRDDWQSLAIGALVPWFVLVVKDNPMYGPYENLIWLVAMMALCGVLAVATRRWIRLS
jgi:hypothetical protein